MDDKFNRVELMTLMLLFVFDVIGFFSPAPERFKDVEVFLRYLTVSLPIIIAADFVALIPFKLYKIKISRWVFNICIFYCTIWGFINNLAFFALVQAGIINFVDSGKMYRFADMIALFIAMVLSSGVKPPKIKRKLNLKKWKLVAETLSDR